MSGDRDLSLLRKAIFDGRIKPDEVRILDRKWWRWVGSLLSHIENEAAVRLFETKHDLHCGLLSYLNKQEAFDSHWNEALNLESLIRSILMPWIKGDTTDRKTSAEKLSDTWTKTFGDLNDKDTQDRINATVKHLEAQAASGRRKFGVK